MWIAPFFGRQRWPSWQGTGCERAQGCHAHNKAPSPRTGQGYLAHKKMPPPGTLQKAYAQGPMVVLGGVQFLMSEVPLPMRRNRGWSWGWTFLLSEVALYRRFSKIRRRTVLGAEIGPPGNVHLQGYLAHKTCPPLGPYRRPMPGVLRGGGIF